MAISRRTFLTRSGLALTAARLCELPLAAQGRAFAYVGRQTPGFAGAAMGGGIDVFRINMTDGSLQPVSSNGPEVQDLNSDGMCVSANGRFLYCVNRTTALGAVPSARTLHERLSRATPAVRSPITDTSSRF